ncbi:MAG: laccase domain-containing protein [Magnetococcales bacterium]|nr:laccase domain-containing protein [Magnetococcales bacterium]
MIATSHGPLRSWHHPDFPLGHRFFGRQGGASQPPFASFNTAWRTEDPHAGENRQLLLQHLGLHQRPGRILNPCHGENIAFVQEEAWQQEEVGVLLQTDGGITQKKGSWLLVSTADCIPMLITDEKQTFAGVVHLGWRNVVANLVGKVVQKIYQEYGIHPQSLILLLGPAIYPCCYRFADPIQRQDPFWQPFLQQGEDGWYAIDLLAATRAQLLANGILAHNILESGLCTGCATEDFFSCYKEGYRSGRFPSVIWLD